MPIYAIGITPLLEILKPKFSDLTTLKRVAFADDLGGAGDLLELRRRWENIVNCGPKLGYNPNASKSWLIVKPEAQRHKKSLEGLKSISLQRGESILGAILEAKTNGTNMLMNWSTRGVVNSWCCQR